MLVVIRSMPPISSAVTAVRIRPTSTSECGSRESTVALLIGYLFVYCLYTVRGWDVRAKRTLRFCLENSN